MSGFHIYSTFRIKQLDILLISITTHRHHLSSPLATFIILSSEKSIILHPTFEIPRTFVQTRTYMQTRSLLTRKSLQQSFRETKSNSRGETNCFSCHSEC